MSKQAITLILLVLLSWAVSDAQKAPPTSVRDRQTQAIVAAVEDEIYDYQLEADFTDLRNRENSASLPIYIKPTLDANGMGRIVYKLMPYGEIIRFFQIRGDGSVVLMSNPQMGFRPTQPNMPTLYLEDEFLLRIKSRWRQKRFTVLFDPPADRIRQAIERQRLRYGISYREQGNQQEDAYAR